MELAIPESSMAKLKEILDMRPSYTIESLITLYKQKFLEKYVQESKQLKTAEDKHNYTISAVWMNAVCTPAKKAYDVIPIGISGTRPTKAGPLAEVFVLIKEKGANEPPVFSSILLYGKATELTKQVQRSNNERVLKYSINLSKKNDGTFNAGEDSRFEQPTSLNMTYESILSKVGSKKLTIDQLAENENLSQFADKYVNSRDWRTVEAVVVSCATFARKDGTTGGVYSIADRTLRPEMFVDKDGNVASSGITVWCAPELAIYPHGSLCLFSGTVTKSNSNLPVMNAYSIVAKLVPEKEA